MDIYIYICCTFTEYAFKFCKLARIIAAVAAKENTPCFPVEESKKKKKCSFTLDRSLERKDSGWFFRWPIMPKGGGDIAPVKKNVIIGSPHGTGGRRRFFSLFAPDF